MKDLGWLWHALGGAAITAAGVIIGIPGWVLFLSLAFFGWAREVIQHDLTLTRHQWTEALAWPFGSYGMLVILTVL